MNKIRKVLRFLRKRQRDFGLPVVDTVPPSEGDYRRLGKEVDEVLVRHDIAVWFPRCVDTVHGGFTAGYSNTWERLPGQTKGLVFHARMSWFAALVSERMTGEAAARFRGYALHGMKVLERLWDSERGGFFWELNEDGTVPAGNPKENYAYGIAFVLYGCANVARVTQDRDALSLAEQTFRWFDERAHDSSNGGYAEILGADGRPALKTCSKLARDTFGTPCGYKSSNTHMHLLEALTELYPVWPDAQLRSRLEELFHIVRDKMFVLPGCLNQSYTADFRPVPALDSYGHDVEAGYLLIEAARVLGMPDDAGTWEKARLLVDNALEYGFDGNLGGFYGDGPVFCNATNLEKVWWVQAEAINALLFLHERFGADDLRYWTAFTRTWQFICRYQVDPRNGGWHHRIWSDDRPILASKGHGWKDAYHTGRALVNVSKILRRLGKEKLPNIDPDIS
jgi:mannobiose 2-epimerase